MVYIQQRYLNQSALTVQTVAIYLNVENIKLNINLCFFIEDLRYEVVVVKVLFNTELISQNLENPSLTFGSFFFSNSAYRSRKLQSINPY